MCGSFFAQKALVRGAVVGCMARSKANFEPESEPCEDSAVQPNNFALSKAAP